MAAVATIELLCAPLRPVTAMRNGRHCTQSGAVRAPLRRTIAHLPRQIKLYRAGAQTGPTVKTRVRRRLRLRPRQARAALETARWAAAMIQAMA